MEIITSKNLWLILQNILLWVGAPRRLSRFRNEKIWKSLKLIQTRVAQWEKLDIPLLSLLSVVAMIGQILLFVDNIKLICLFVYAWIPEKKGLFLIADSHCSFEQQIKNKLNLYLNYTISNCRKKPTWINISLYKKISAWRELG